VEVGTYFGTGKDCPKQFQPALSDERQFGRQLKNCAPSTMRSRVGLHELSDHIAAAAPFRMRWMLGGAKNSGIGTVPTTAPMKRSVSG
jgi:hypothetical protein